MVDEDNMIALFTCILVIPHMHEPDQNIVYGRY